MLIFLSLSLSPSVSIYTSTRPTFTLASTRSICAYTFGTYAYLYLFLDLLTPYRTPHAGLSTKSTQVGICDVCRLHGRLCCSLGLPAGSPELRGGGRPQLGICPLDELHLTVLWINMETPACPYICNWQQDHPRFLSGASCQANRLKAVEVLRGCDSSLSGRF